MNIKRIMLSVVLLVAATLMAGAQTAGTQEEKDLDSLYAQTLLKAGVEAPDFILPMVDGCKLQLQDFRGKYVLLDFWASWCPDCRKDIPVVKQLHEMYGAKVEFIGVSFDTDRDRWAKCVADNGMQWKQVSELKKMRESKTATDYGVKWIPSMTLIAPDGKVVLSTVVVDRMEKALSEIK